jgi:hypothetical protein
VLSDRGRSILQYTRVDVQVISALPRSGMMLARNDSASKKVLQQAQSPDCVELTASPVPRMN